MKRKFLIAIVAASAIMVASFINSANNVVSGPETIYLQQNEQDMKKIITAHLTLKPEKVGQFINDTNVNPNPQYYGKHLQ